CYCYVPPRSLHSFPTRRSSDLDVILEMLANVNLGKDLGLLAERGRVVVIGSRGTVEIDPRATMGRDASILGMVLAKTPEPEMARDRKSTRLNSSHDQISYAVFC